MSSGTASIRVEPQYEDSGPITELWVPFLVFAHIFAGFWLLKAYLLVHPNAFGSLRRLLKRATGNCTSQRVSSGDGASEKLAAGGALGSIDEHATDTDGAAEFGGAEGGDASGSDEAPPSEVRVSLPITRRFSTMIAPLSLSWRNVGCSYATANGAKVVLSGVHGEARPGEVHALIGPSGAGKSTLMDILAARKSTGHVSGEVLVNGRPRCGAFHRRASYVPQYDSFIPTMTTEETLSFYASLILPPDMNKEQRKRRVAEVLAVVGLHNHAGTLVGGHLPGGLMLRGLSGGERKRLSIAAGIIATPSVVFLDEPTSGLDAFAALTVMRYLQQMAKEARHIVLASIHQPRSAIWAMFDSVTLVSAGRLLYTGSREELVPWFSGRLGYAYDAATHGVASDWVMDLVSINYSKATEKQGSRCTLTMASVAEVHAAADAFEEHYLAANGSGGATPAAEAAADNDPPDPPPARFAAVTALEVEDAVAAKMPAVSGCLPCVWRPAMAESGGGSYASGFWRQYRCLLWRDFLAITRNPADVAGRMLTFTYVGVLVGVLFYGMAGDLASARLRLNLIFANECFFILMPYVSMSLYVADKAHYLADVSSRLYRPAAYYAAKITATAPFSLLSALVFCGITYGMAGLRDTPLAIVENAVINCILSLIAIQVLHCAAILAPNQDTAFMMSIAWTAIQMLFSTYIIPYSDMRFGWISNGRWLSAMSYSWDALVQSEFRGRLFNCDSGIMPGDSTRWLKALFPNNALLSSPFVQQTLSTRDPTCVAVSAVIPDFFGLYRPFAHTVGILIAYLAVTHVATFASLLVITARKERR